MVTKEDLDKHDTMLAHALEFNKTNPIKYNGMWFPKGTLKLLLDAGMPTHAQPKRKPDHSRGSE